MSERGPHERAHVEDRGPRLRNRTGIAYRTPPPRSDRGVVNPEFINSDPSKRRRRQSSPIDTVYQDAQRLLHKAIMHTHAGRAAEVQAYNRALNKFEQVPDSHGYAADFKLLCREIVERLNGGPSTAALPAEAVAALPSEVASRLDELQQAQHRIEREREAERQRAAEEEERDKWKHPANWPHKVGGLLYRQIKGKVTTVVKGLVGVLLWQPIVRTACSVEWWQHAPGGSFVAEKVCA